MNLIKSYFNKYKYNILIILISIGLIFTNIVAIRQCNSYKNQNNNNIDALTDTIKYYKTKTNELYVSKTLLTGDLKTLQVANDSLYRVIKEMKIKNPTSVVYVDATIDNSPKDTAWTIDKPKTDFEMVYPSLSKNFSFIDKYRELTGNISLNDSILSLNIEKDKVFLDYTLAIENNQVFVKSNNPYVKYNMIQGITLPENKKSRVATLVFGPSVNIGYDFNTKKVNPTIGLSLTYGIDLLNLIKK